MSSIVPPEICDYIIDYLWDDYRALAACSLTCRSWLSSSRSHLFNFIHLERERDILQFLEILDNPPIASVSLARCVRDLTVAGTVARNHQCILDAVTQILDHLNHVECLRVNTRGIIGWHLQERLKDHLLTFSPEIRKLHISSAHVFEWAHLEHLFELISGFPKLSSLEIDGDNWTRVVHPPKPSSNTLSAPEGVDKIALKSLKMMHAGRSMTDPILTWLHRPTFDLQLRELRITIDDWMQHKKLLQVSALRVQNLYFNWNNILDDGIGEFKEIVIVDNDLTQGILDQHDLSCYLSLVHVRFEGIPLQFSHRNRTQLHTLLSSIESSHLQTLTFCIASLSLTSLTSLRWQPFDDVLQGLASKCPKLSIKFHIEFPVRIKDWDRGSAQFHTNSLVSQLPKTQAQKAYFIVLFRQHTGRSVCGQELVDVSLFDPVDE